MPAVEVTGERVEQLLTELTEAAGPVAAGLAEELVRALVELYGTGLARVVEVVAEQPGLLTRITGDPLLAALLVLHDLHPASTELRVRQAVERIRPFLGRHAGDVELLEVTDTAVRLRLTGSCEGCPSSQETVRNAIESAVTSAAPEIETITVAGVAAQPPLLQIETAPRHPYAGAACPAEPTVVQAEGVPR